MIPLELLPASLRTATLDEQLSYLLQRRNMIERLVRSLETYIREEERARRESPSPQAA